MQTLRASKCGLSTAQLPSSILDVIDSLTKAGYEAYIVGGGVRDLMLGLNPKDFDAVTNATPSQIKEVFGRRCRIIGRRFELAHVYSGRELIEVATFRAPPKKAVTSASGMILRDNNWGTIEQDFARRDFSINTLYYQPRKSIVLDFCKAIDDVKNTINKLEKLYKSKKYSHKRIWQVGMIMKVRLEVLKNKKPEQFKLANKYFKFLGKRTKLDDKERYKLTFEK